MRVIRTEQIKTVNNVCTVVITFTFIMKVDNKSTVDHSNFEHFSALSYALLPIPIHLTLFVVYDLLF